jgi:hypothetical protein
VSPLRLKKPLVRERPLDGGACRSRHLASVSLIPLWSGWRDGTVRYNDPMPRRLDHEAVASLMLEHGLEPLEQYRAPESSGDAAA